jgi:hypothetical protein
MVRGQRRSLIDWHLHLRRAGDAKDPSLFLLDPIAFHRRKRAITGEQWFKLRDAVQVRKILREGQNLSGILDVVTDWFAY